LIIPWAAGGPADGGFRILAESAAKKLGQPIVVDNKAGASGVLGAIALQDAKPDGYVISQMHIRAAPAAAQSAAAVSSDQDLTHPRSRDTSWAWWCADATWQTCRSSWPTPAPTRAS
jgi:tripartite-type tricarboxylate transporter receptor subunit TctC